MTRQECSRIVNNRVDTLETLRLVEGLVDVFGDLGDRDVARLG
jgi:hypothetical protein